ncbi:MAG: bleomycin resistance protein [Kosmotoga sp.]|nr:MAG: bleomycin resistance protein [Kosmotoga sp.]
MGRKKIIYYWEINASSAPELAKFYNDIFDWEYEYEEKNEFFSFKTSDDKGGIGDAIFTGKGKIRPHRALNVLVNSADDPVEKVKQAGGTILQYPFESENVKLAFFEDPEGHVTGIVEKLE